MALDHRIIDVGDPPAPYDGLIPGTGGHGATNSTRLQTMIDGLFTNSPATSHSFYFSINRWQFSNTVTWPNFNGLRVFGGGGICKSLSAMSAKTGGVTYIEWTGGAVGPLFRLRDNDGDIWQYLNFDGTRGPEKNSGVADHLDVLIQHQRIGALSGALFHHYQNCSFFRAQRLFFAGGGALGAGTADFTFSKCMFNCGELSTHRWTSQAFYADNPQTVNTLFDSNCEFNNCAYCAKFANGAGRVSFRNPTIAVVGTMIERSGGSQNVAGDEIWFPHLDSGSGAEGRKALWKSTSASTTMGPVVIQTPKYGSVDPLSQEFSLITSFSGVNLTLTSPIRMRVGDIIQFVPKADIDGGIFDGANKVETTIGSRTDDNTYTTAVDAATLGITTPANWYACNGEALVTCVSSDSVELRNAFLTGHHIWGGRLARLTHSSFSTGRSPKFLARDCMAFWGVDFNEAGLETLLSMTGTCYWRFENADPIGDGNPPSTFGNYGVFPATTGADTTIINQEHEVIMRKYATSHVVKFTLKDPSTGTFKPGVTFEAGDAKLIVDEAAPANTTNLPTAIGGGKYKITLTAAEVTGKQVDLLIQDLTVPANFAPREVSIDTYGHDDAQHALDIDVTNVNANLKSVDDDTAAVARYKRAAKTMFLVTIGSGSTVDTLVTSSIDPAVNQLNSLKNRVLLFAADSTTAALRGKSVDITGSTVGGVLTVSPPLPVLPVSGDTAIAS